MSGFHLAEYIYGGNKNYFPKYNEKRARMDPDPQIYFPDE